jgi:hypothetical protein
MASPQEQALILDALNALGISPHEFQVLARMPYAAACEQLQALKARMKKAYRKLVFELHPDRTGNDPVKTALLTTLSTVVRDIEGLAIPKPPPPQPRPVMVAVRGTWVGRHVTTQTQTSTANATSVHHVVFLRPV